MRSQYRKPIPKSQKEISKELQDPVYLQQGNPNNSDSTDNRGNKTSWRDDSTKLLNIGIEDIDNAIIYYIQNEIKPFVIQNGERIEVPIIYGSPERWKSVQKDGYYKDKNGAIMLPIMVIKRDNISPIKNIANKLDANNPNNYGTFQKAYSSRNAYTSFDILNNIKPQKEYYNVVVPDYVTITYSCVISTYFIEQLNKIVEGINYASDSYWGDPERFKFRASIDNYSTAVDLSKGQDRAVKTTFTINLFGYVIPDTINTELLGARRSFSKSRVSFKIETVKNKDELLLRSRTPEKESTRRFYDNPGPQPDGPSLEEIIFISTSNFAVADLVNLNEAVFLNKTIFTPPPGYSLDEDSFSVFVNGVSITPQHVLIQQTGNNITATFNSSLMGYSVEPTDSVLLTGKFK